MTEYIHSVPGRLRIRSSLLRSGSGHRGELLRNLRRLSGVDDLRLNHKSGSVVICYQPAQVTVEQIIAAFEQHKCVTHTVTRKAQTTTRSAAGSVNISPVPWQMLTRQVGKVAVNMLISRGVSYSLTSLLGK